MNIALQVFGILLSAAATLIGTLVLWNFKMLEKRLDSQEDRLKNLEQNQLILTKQKETCQQEFVPIGQFLRESGYTRKRLDDAIEALKGVSVKVDIVSQLPQIVSQIVSQTVKELMPFVKG
jgi:hypothetical protein